tara:strand:+ start:242 stop:412 length:171 start_codon:yes stop_codon:yes gene_type:complete
MKIYTIAPMEDPREAAETFSYLESLGYDVALAIIGERRRLRINWKIVFQVLLTEYH